MANRRTLRVVKQSARELCQQLREMLREGCSQPPYARGLFVISQSAVVTEFRVRAAHRDLIRQHGDADVSKYGAQMDKSAKSAETTGGCRAKNRSLAGDG